MFLELYKKKYDRKYRLHSTYSSINSVNKAAYKLRQAGYNTHVKATNMTLVAPYVVQLDITGRIAWIGDASDTNHAIKRYKEQTGSAVPDGYLVVTMISRALERALRNTETDSAIAARLIDDYVAAN